MILTRRLFLATPAAAFAAKRGPMMVYFGTYTRGASKGIYVSRFDPAAGKLSAPELAAETLNPSFLVIHPAGRHLYAVGEMSGAQGQPGGSVSAFAIDSASGKLSQINQQPSGGGGPCHINIDRARRHVLIANYGGGSIAVFPLAADGSLKPASAFVQHRGPVFDAKRQGGPHAHSIHVDKGNRFVLATDLGLDKVLVYRFDAARGTLTPNEPAFASLKPGAGPRHFAFHPSFRYAYAINEITCTVTAFAYDARRGVLSELQTITTLPGPVQQGFSTAEVQVHPSGKFLYGSNRGHDSIAVFRIDRSRGTLTPVEHEPTQGRMPRNFGIDPTGRFLLAANMNSNSVVVFRIDPRTGALDPTGEKLEVPTPVCVKFRV